jgi:hypothetical protein
MRMLHDQIFAAVSHLPHLLAFALMDELASRPLAETYFRYAGSGLRDATRIAGSHPEMWRDITLANKDALLAELDAWDRQASASTGRARMAWRWNRVLPTRARRFRTGCTRQIQQRLTPRASLDLKIGHIHGISRSPGLVRRPRQGAPARLEKHLQPHVAAPPWPPGRPW